jgi:hypothetical protein
MCEGSTCSDILYLLPGPGFGARSAETIRAAPEVTSARCMLIDECRHKGGAARTTTWTSCRCSRLPAGCRSYVERRSELLDPDVVLRVDRGAFPPGASREVRGAPTVAEQVRTFARLARFAQPALVNGAAGFVVAPRGRPVAVAGFTVADGRIVEIDLLADPARLRDLDLTALGG